MVIPVNYFLYLSVILLLGLLIIQVDCFYEIVLRKVPVATSVQGCHLPIGIFIRGCYLTAFDSHDDWLHIALIFQVTKALVHFLHLITVIIMVELTPRCPVSIWEVVARGGWYGMEVADLATSRYWLLIYKTFSLPPRQLSLLVNNFYQVILVTSLREVADGLTQQVFLLEEEVIVRRHIVLIIGGDTAPSVADVKVRALLLHFADQFVVHFYLLKNRLLLLALF